jgi:hypothetical protein
MDNESAKANLIPGKDVAYIARCMDALLQSDCSDPSVIDLITPFLAPKLLDNRVIDFSIDPGVDITDHYFVLWEPFIRGKTALLLGTIAEKAATLPDLTSIVTTLVEIFTNGVSEEIELSFSFFAIAHIARRQPQAVLPHFQKLVRFAGAFVGLAAYPPKAFGLFHSIPFQTEAFDSFLNFVSTIGLFETPDNVQRLVAAGLPITLFQIAQGSSKFEEKHPEMLWKWLTIFLRLITEHPNGYQLFDLDRIPRDYVNDLLAILRLVLLSPSGAGAIRNEVSATPTAARTTQAVKDLLKKLQSK